MNKINFQITGDCNKNCKFCCDNFKHLKHQNLEEIKRMIDHLPDTLEEIQVTGGEPLLHPDIEEVCQYIKEKGIKVSLSTNGILLTKMPSILPHIDKIILPLDAVLLGRTDTQLVTTIQNVAIIHSNFPNIEVAINTVLTKQNYKELGKILGLVRMLDCTEWNIYQFLPHGSGKENIRDFLMDDRDFKKIITSLECCETENKIVPISVSDMVDNEWTITPNLLLTKLSDDKPVYYGSIFDVSDILLKELFKSKENKVKSQVYSQH